MDSKIKYALKQFNKIQTLKSKVEKNKLCNRSDVQMLRKKISTLNQEILHAKQDTEQKKAAYDEAKKKLDRYTNEHTLYVEHLTIIIENHKKQQEKQLSELMKAMKMPQEDVISQQEGNKQVHT